MSGLYHSVCGRIDIKTLSASIIVLAGAVLVASGVNPASDDARLFVQVAGGVVGIAGLVTWWRAYSGITKPDNE